MSADTEGVQPRGIGRTVRDALTRNLVLAAILLVALAIRMVDITMPLIDSFSWRQASTAMMADNFRLSSWNIFYPEVSWTGPGPSYQGREFQLLSYITAILHAVFGWHDWMGRLVAVVFSMVTVFSLHRLVAEIWDESHAHAAAIVYAILPAAITIDSSFLPDPAMLALVTLGVWLFVRYWSGRGGAWLLIAASTAFTLGVLSKLPGIAAGVAVFFLVIVSGFRNGWARQWPVILAMVLQLVAIVAYYGWALYLGTTYPPYHVAGSGYLWDHGLRAFLNEGYHLRSLHNIATWWFYSYPLIALFALGLWAGSPREVPNRTVAAVPLAWLLGFVLLYLVAAREITNNPWNLHILSVPFAIFAGRGLTILVEISWMSVKSFNGLLQTAVLAGLLGVFAAWPLVQNVRTPYAQNGMLLGQALYEASAPGDLVIAVSRTVGDPIAIYYSRRRGWVFPPGGGRRTWSNLRDDQEEALAELEELRAEGAGWFGVTKNAVDWMGRRFVDHHAELLQHLDVTAELVADTPAYIIYKLRP